MYIAEYMTSDPITVSTATLLPEARRILNEYQIRHLPVIDRDRCLIGIVTDRDLRSAYPSTVVTRDERHLAFERVENSTVEDIMTNSCSTLLPDASLDEALLIFDQDKVGGIPVVSEEGVVIGMFSLLDLIAAYRKLFGVVKDGSLFICVEDDGRENILSELVSLFEEHNYFISRIIRLVEGLEREKIFVRVNCDSMVEVLKVLRKKEFVIIEP